MQPNVAIIYLDLVIIMSIGERISQLRTEQNISQGQLADMLDVSRQAVSKWENDLSSPDTIRLIKLADILNTDLEYLAMGRNSYRRRPPIVVKSIETIEKVVEKPVVQVIEKVVETPVVQYVEKPVLQYVDNPIVRKVYRTKYLRNPGEYILVAVVSLIIGIIIGIIL